MSDVREYHRRIESALADGDVERALETRTELQGTDPPVDELLAEFESAVADGDYAEAETVRQALRERLAERRSTDRRSIQRSTVARDAGDLSGDDARAIRDHIGTGMELSSSRASFLVTSAMFLARPEDADDGDVLTEARALEEREREYESVAATAEDAAGDAALPASVEFVGSGVDDETVAVGDATTARVRVANVGGRRATGIAIVPDPGDGLSVSPDERSVDAIDPDGTVEVAFEVTGRESGSGRLGIRVEAETGGSGHTRLSVDVENDPDRSPVLEAFTGPDGSVRFEDVVDAIARYNDEEPIPDTGQPVAFQDVMWVLELYDEGA